MKTETWNGYGIRFVEHNGEWWAVGADLAKVLGYNHTPHMTRLLDDDEKDAVRLVDTIGREQEMTIISEIGIYEAIFESKKQEVIEFKKWVKQLLKQLRQSTGLEGFQIFRMLDKEHQKEAMRKLHKSLQDPKRVDYIKANTIANKAVSIKYGYTKMIKKDDMTPEMLKDRQELLENAVELMQIKEKYSIDLSVSERVYSIAKGQRHTA